MRTKGWVSRYLSCLAVGIRFYCCLLVNPSMSIKLKCCRCMQNAKQCKSSKDTRRQNASLNNPLSLLRLQTSGTHPQHPFSALPVSEISRRRLTIPRDPLRLH